MYSLSLYELLWLFFIYSFLGWILETMIAAWKQRKFANRGLVNGPFCVIYGIAAAVMSISLREMTGIWLFLFAAVYATVIEWIAGHLIEKAFKARWWNYSGMKWNLDGYICLPMSLLWGLLGFVTVRWGNVLFLHLLSLLPGLFMRILLLALIVILIIDILSSYLLLRGKSRHLSGWAAANNEIDKVASAWDGRFPALWKNVSARLTPGPSSLRPQRIPRKKRRFLLQAADFTRSSCCSLQVHC